MMKTCWWIGSVLLPKLLSGNVVNTTCIMMLIPVVKIQKEIVKGEQN